MAAEEPRNGHLFCTVGRMNPPTSGHMRIIEHLFRSALPVGGKVVLFISESTSKEKLSVAQISAGKVPKENPLLCEKKKEFLTKMIRRLLDQNTEFSEIPFEIVCGNPVPNMFGYVARKRPEQVHLILGNEPEKVELGETFRSGFFDEVLPKWKDGDSEEKMEEKRRDALEKTRSRQSTYGGMELVLHFMDRPPGSISATMVRNSVKAGNKSGFNVLYDMEQANKNALFTNIVRGLNRMERELANSAKGKRSKRNNHENKSANNTKKRKTVSVPRSRK